MEIRQQLNYLMNNGQKSSSSCVVAQRCTSVRKLIAAASLKACSGWLAAVLNGDCCPSSMANGTASTSGLPAGVIKGSGNECIIILPMTQIWNILSLTARWCGPILALLGPPQKPGTKGAGSGPEPRRIQHQNPRERGCLGQPLAL